jgi:hypothetical protein
VMRGGLPYLARPPDKCPSLLLQFLPRSATTENPSELVVGSTRRAAALLLLPGKVRIYS